MLIKLKHLKVSDGKLFFSGSNHLPEVNVSIGFQHTIGSNLTNRLLIGSILSDELLASELVPKSHNLELTIVACYYVTDVKILELDLRILYFFQEYFMILDVVLHRGRSTISIWLVGTK